MVVHGPLGIVRVFLARCGVDATPREEGIDGRFRSQFTLPRGWTVMEVRSKPRITGKNQSNPLDGDDRRICLRVPKGMPTAQVGRPLLDIPVMVTLGAFTELLDAYYEVHGRSWTAPEGEEF